mmetsp:Transcript_77881/g.128777  ORF Transcript_77881/g.128777 Transcript_77881/m.128777 type:complete len:257 (+) Transcript_77881:676-1446(+)
MIHSPQQGHNHAERIHGCLFATQMRIPKIGNSTMGGLKLLDQRAILSLSNEVGRDEAWASMHLCHLIRQHVAIVVVAGHTKTSISPTDDLHGSSIADQVLQLTVRLLQEPRFQKVSLVICVEDFLHDLPETFLPLEDCLLGNHIGNHLGFKAALEENVCQILHIVQWVVIDHNATSIILHLPAVHDNGLSLIHAFWKESGEHPSLAHLLPARSILTAHGMALEEHGSPEAQLDARDVNGVPGDSDSIPTPTHQSVW